MQINWIPVTDEIEAMVPPEPDDEVGCMYYLAACEVDAMDLLDGNVPPKRREPRLGRADRIVLDATTETDALLSRHRTEPKAAGACGQCGRRVWRWGNDGVRVCRSCGLPWPIEDVPMPFTGGGRPGSRLPPDSNHRLKVQLIIGQMQREQEFDGLVRAWLAVLKAGRDCKARRPPAIISKIAIQFCWPPSGDRRSWGERSLRRAVKDAQKEFLRRYESC